MQLAELGFDVTYNDLDGEMLAKAQSEARDRGLGDKMQFSQVCRHVEGSTMTAIFTAAAHCAHCAHNVPYIHHQLKTLLCSPYSLR